MSGHLPTWLTFTGWDRGGGYADMVTAEESFVYGIPAELTDAQAAPLLCSRMIGYQALKRADAPTVTLDLAFLFACPSVLSRE